MKTEEARKYTFRTVKEAVDYVRANRETCPPTVYVDSSLFDHLTATAPTPEPAEQVA